MAHVEGKAEIHWRRDPKMWGADAAERAIVPGGRYELAVFDIPASGRDSRIIGWEFYAGEPDYLDLVANGEAETFEDAKAAAVAAWVILSDPAAC